MTSSAGWQPAKQPSTMHRLPSVSSLMSPPETKPLESFPASLSPFAKPRDSSTRDIQLPPISADRKRTQSEMDLPSPPPLFGPVHPPSAEALVEEHMNSHMAIFRNKLNKPTRDEYLLALSCVPIVSTQYNRNPGAWAREERETLERQMAMMNRYRPRDYESKLKKIAPAPQQVFDNFEPPQTPLTKPRALGTNRDDTDYHSLKDYSPPTETLGSNAKALKADWKGQMLDLSNDPDRNILSPAELNLASTLRLSCATYLCSKRRIFEARVRALGVGKEFRKTDAQQACKIDVNKASKLWTAYERVGWFKPEYFHQYLT
ncbi:hypothetical protein N7489_007933 [Penicillium chrysogenum]|uniref:uncharacterized protein n=1 Tax=Penicillium chrysogenum TaxID=5076 RepID=UPI0024DF226C|nr:uncharacterized protein N7489_007933 [Penicillium chrysogenum]KAJ5237842.1 hypothetical protein N7489_007933 [Penicillium chrysogenum]